MKGFVVGFPKAGTTTIHEACIRSGLKSAHWRVREGFCGKMIYKRYLAGQDPLLDFKGYDMIAQADVCRPASGLNFWPNLDIALLLTIRRFHPDCCFVLNTRDMAPHIKSISGWPDLRQSIIDADIIGLPAGYGKNDEHLRIWIENHYRACRAVFANDEKFVELPITKDDSSRAILQNALGVEIGWWGVSPKTVSKAGQKSNTGGGSVSLAAL